MKHIFNLVIASLISTFLFVSIKQTSMFPGKNGKVGKS